MADFDNLLGEIDENVNLRQSNDDEGLGISQNENETRQNNTTGSASTESEAQIPPALLEAESLLRREKGDDIDDRNRNETNNMGDESDNKEEEEEDDRQFRPDSDYERLKYLWIQELNCTELLPHDESNSSLLLDILSDQEETIDQLNEQGCGSVGGGVDPSLASLAAGICKMDSDRLAFVLSDLMRTRLFKIEKYALHNREILDRMSKEEITYLQKYGTLYERHMQRSVTDHLPKEAWKKMDEPEMIERPNLDEYVFCRVVADEVTLNNETNMNIEDDDDEDFQGGAVTDETFQKGSQLFVRYAVIRSLVLEGKVDLM